MQQERIDIRRAQAETGPDVGPNIASLQLTKKEEERVTSDLDRYYQDGGELRRFIMTLASLKELDPTLFESVSRNYSHHAIWDVGQEIAAEKHADLNDVEWDSKFEILRALKNIDPEKYESSICSLPSLKNWAESLRELLRVLTSDLSQPDYYGNILAILNALDLIDPKIEVGSLHAMEITSDDEGRNWADRLRESIRFLSNSDPPIARHHVQSLLRVKQFFPDFFREELMNSGEWRDMLSNISKLAANARSENVVYREFTLEVLADVMRLIEAPTIRKPDNDKSLPVTRTY